MSRATTHIRVWPEHEAALQKYPGSRTAEKMDYVLSEVSKKKREDRIIEAFDIIISLEGVKVKDVECVLKIKRDYIKSMMKKIKAKTVYDEIKEKKLPRGVDIKKKGARRIKIPLCQNCKNNQTACPRCEGVNNIKCVGFGKGVVLHICGRCEKKWQEKHGKIFKDKNIIMDPPVGDMPKEEIEGL